MIERLLTLGVVLLGLVIFQSSARGQQRTIQLPLLEISENQPTPSSSSQVLSTPATAPHRKAVGKTLPVRSD